MRVIHATLVPITPYAITSSRRGRGRGRVGRDIKIYISFYRGVYPMDKYLPPSSIKGMLRSAAVYIYRDRSCEYASSIIFKRWRCERTPSLTCSDLDDPRKIRDRYGGECGSNIDSVVTDISNIKLPERPCIVCRVFGNTAVRGKARVVVKSQLVYSNSIDKRTVKIFTSKDGIEKRAIENLILELEVSMKPIKFDVICEDEECVEVIKKCFEAINHQIVRLGGYKSRGFGIAKISYWLE